MTVVVKTLENRVMHDILNDNISYIYIYNMIIIVVQPVITIITSFSLRCYFILDVVKLI